MTEYLKNHSFPLRSVTDGEDFSDLQPLKEILKGARIVGLGESTHGTREHFQLKHRLTRFLVEEMGCREFTIEAGGLSCDPIDEYITMGKGDLAEAVTAQGFWTWNTEEVLAMIEWMREHNRTCRRGEEVRFLGCDIKPMAEACARLTEYIGKYAPEFLTEATAIMEEASAQPLNWPGTAAPVVSRPMLLLGWITAREQELIALSSPEEYAAALLSARFILQSYESQFDILNIRDKYTYENTVSIMNSLPAGSKAIFWAHNAHISRQFAFHTVGGRLADHYGSAYCPLGFMFRDGQFTTVNCEKDPKVGPEVYPMPAPMHDTWDEDFASALEGVGFVDLTDPEPELMQWLAPVRRYMALDESWFPNDPDQSIAEISLGKSFDCIIFTEHTHATVLNPKL